MIAQIKPSLAFSLPNQFPDALLATLSSTRGSATSPQRRDGTGFSQPAEVTQHPQCPNAPLHIYWGNRAVRQSGNRMIQGRGPFTAAVTLSQNCRGQTRTSGPRRGRHRIAHQEGPGPSQVKYISKPRTTVTPTRRSHSLFSFFLSISFHYRHFR